MGLEATVAVIGGGAFGTALACVARRSGNAVRLWAREAAVVQDINKRRRNEAFLPDVALPAGIVAFDSLAEAVEGARIVLLAPPAQHMRAVTAALSASIAFGTPVVSCSKGVERATSKLMPEVIAETLPQAVVAVLSGPSFAAGVARDLPCAVVLACADAAARRTLIEALANPRFGLQASTDVTGAALAGAMKNVVSIASGIAHAQAMGENTRATLVTLGLEEAARLGAKKGARLETFLGLAGAGDFMLTAMSLASRNTALGVALGEGRSVEAALAGKRAVTEGVASVEGVARLALELGVGMPITSALHGLIDLGMPLAVTLERLFHDMPALCGAAQCETMAAFH